MVVNVATFHHSKMIVVFYEYGSNRERIIGSLPIILWSQNW